MTAPKLRFKEFDGDWRINTFSSISKHISYGLTVRPDFVESGIPLVSAREIAKGLVNINKAPKISNNDFLKLSNKAKPRRNDLFLSKTGSIGFTAIVETDETFAITQNIAIIRLDNLALNNPIFFLHQMRTEKFQQSAIMRVNQSTIMDLQLGDIKKLELGIPQKEEQTKIASFLSAVDEKISQLTQKHALLSQYKQGMMQKLFGQQIRFKADDGREFRAWEETELGKHCQIKTGKLDANAMRPNGEFRFYTCAKEFYLIDEYAFDTEALLISGNGANVGYIHYYKGKFNAYQRTYVLDQWQQNIIFIQYFLEKFLKERIYSEKKEGNTPYIVLSTLSEMPLLLPCLEEQTKIANFLSAIDQKIEVVAQQIEQAKVWKKGLLQQMFV